MGPKRAPRRNHRATHHGGSCDARVVKYVEAELRRMKLHNGGQGQFTGFRVHPEFGWCDKALREKGLAVDRHKTWWRKMRNLVRLQPQREISV